MKSVRFLPSYRLLVLILACIEISVLTGLQGTISMAWVCMVEQPKDHNDTFIVNSSRNQDQAMYSEIIIPTDKLKWDRDIQQHVFSGDNFGMLAVILPIGYFVNKFGAKYILGFGVIIASVATMLIPPSAYISYGIAIALRIIMGIGNATGFPSIYYICSRWSIKSELGISLALVTLGYDLGPFITYLLAGVQCQNLSWHFVFYISGAISLGSVIFWLIFYFHEPNHGSYVPEDEANYILKHRAPIKEYNLHGIPWCRLLLSPAVLGCILSAAAHGFILTLVRKFTPIYFAEVVGLSIIGNSLYSSIQYLAQIVSRLIAGILSDKLPFKSPTIILKIFNTAGFIGVFGCLIGLAFVDNTSPKAVPIFLISASMFFLNLCIGGWQKSPLYIAPQHSTIVATLLLFITAATATIVSYVVGALVTRNTADQWHVVFYIGAAFAAAGAISFAVFGSGESQPWAKQTSSVATEKFMEPKIIIMKF